MIIYYYSIQSMKYRRCPNGTRKNKKEDCIDTNGNIVIQREDRIINEVEDVVPILSTPENPPFISFKSIRAAILEL